MFFDAVGISLSNKSSFKSWIGSRLMKSDEVIYFFVAKARILWWLFMVLDVSNRVSPKNQV